MDVNGQKMAVDKRNTIKAQRNFVFICYGIEKQLAHHVCILFPNVCLGSHCPYGEIQCYHPNKTPIAGSCGQNFSYHLTFAEITAALTVTYMAD